MPNYTTRLYNEIVDHAEELYDFFSGDYMNGFENRLLDCGADRIEIGPMQFVRILQYRKTTNIRNDLKTIQTAISACLGYCARNMAAFGYYLISKDDEFRVFLSVEGIPADGVIRLLSGMIPEISFRTGFIPPSDMKRLSSCSGIISGDIHCTEPIANMLFQAYNGRNGILGVLAVPMARSEASSYTDALNVLLRQTEDLLSDDMAYSFQSRKTNKRSYRFIPELNAKLKEMTEYYRSSGEDYWKTCLWFSTEDRQSLNTIGNAISGILNSANDSSDKARVFFTTETPFQQGRLFLPAPLFGDHRFEYEDALLKPSLISYVSNTHLSSILQFPSSQINGFDVIELTKTENSIHLFDLNQPSYQDNGIALGRVADSGIGYALPLQDLMEHVLVTGSTGAGKTNTVFTLVQGVHAFHIPALIIEPSKKEYWLLGSMLQDLKVYSFGKDADLLQINPLIPEEGVLIGNHIDSLLYAFSGAFEMEEPTRLALDGLLKYTYMKSGWTSGDIAIFSRKPFPQIKDLLRFLPEYCEQNLPYGEEVRNNIYGSLVNRLSSINSGVLGESMNTAHPIMGKDLCSGTVLIELDDLSLETKPFIAMLVMIKADQYLRQKNASHRLNNVIVLEEAHNVFANVAKDKRQEPRDKASHYFSNMLSQIRGYGAGIIIADQGASQINDMAVSNTKVKIIHGIVDQDDMDRVAFALNLTDIQKRVFPSLQTGDAIIGIRASRNVNRVRINQTRITPIHNIACLFCKRKQFCVNFNKENSSPIPRVSLTAQHILQYRFDPMSLSNELHIVAKHMEWPQGKDLCLLGLLLSDRSVFLGEREKRRIIQRYLQTCSED